VLPHGPRHDAAVGFADHVVPVAAAARAGRRRVSPFGPRSRGAHASRRVIVLSTVTCKRVSCCAQGRRLLVVRTACAHVHPPSAHRSRGRCSCKDPCRAAMVHACVCPAVRCACATHACASRHGGRGRRPTCTPSRERHRPECSSHGVPQKHEQLHVWQRSDGLDRVFVDHVVGCLSATAAASACVGARSAAHTVDS